MNDRGFTLTELLVALALLGLILAGVFTLHQQGQLAYLAGAARVQTQQSARVALDLMSREVRSATSVTAIAGSDLTFVDQNSVTIQYRLNGNDLERTEAGTMTLLTRNVQDLQFTYRDLNGAVTATAANVANVEISIRTWTEDSTSYSVSPTRQEMVVQDRVRLRNML